jgi:hypothetical protein
MKPDMAWRHGRAKPEANRDYPPVDLAGELERLAGRLNRLSPDWRNAEHYHQEKSEIVAIRKLARNTGGKP